MCGDSIAVDWHLSVDLSSGGFGWTINARDSSGFIVQASPHIRAQSRIKKHSSFDLGGKRYGYSGSITLEECLDSFAKEERIPEVRFAICSVLCLMFAHATHLVAFFLESERHTVRTARSFESKQKGSAYGVALPWQSFSSSDFNLHST
jgi:hypothetical protein